MRPKPHVRFCREATGSNSRRPPNNMLLIQAISTEWTKTSRGGSNATRRNGVPEQLAIPVTFDPASTSGVMLHRVGYSEGNGFLVPHLDWIAVQAVPEEGIRYNNFLVLHPSDGSLRITCEWGNLPGAPKRYPARVQTALEPDQWMRLRYNARLSRGEGLWVYEKWIFNIAVLRTLSSRIFLDTEPSEIRSEMADLW